MEISLIGEASAFGTEDYRFESYISNINKLNLNYFHNRISVRNITKPNYTFLKPTKTILMLLRFFHYEGIVESFNFSQHNLLKVYFSYINGIVVFRYARFLFKNKKKISVSISAIRYFIRNSYSIIYFSTPNGVLSSEEILRYKTTGYAICIIYS